jgi:hypothetical protein
LLWGVDLLGDCAQLVPASIGIVVGDCVPASLQLRGDQLGELDVQGEVNRGEVEQTLPEDLERLFGEADEVVGGIVGEGGEMCAGEGSSERPRGAARPFQSGRFSRGE